MMSHAKPRLKLGTTLFSFTSEFHSREYTFEQLVAEVARRNLGPGLEIIGFQSIRGRIFLDVGGAWFDYAGQGFTFWNGDENRLQDAVSSYGWGVTVKFAGLDLNWDFAKQWDFKESTAGGFRTSFWIGTGF